MSRASSITNDPNPPGLHSLTGLSSLSRQPLTPDQQLQALKRVQAQAEQRVKLGMQLFKAAEARLSTQTDMLGQIKTLQDQLREQVNQDVAKSLHEYDQWIGQIDESFTTAIRKLEEKIDAVQSNIVSSESRIQNMLQRAEALLDQNRALVEQNSLKSIDEPTQSPASALTPAPKPKPTILDSVAASKQIAQNPTPLSTPPTPAEPAAADSNNDPDNEPHKFQPEQEKIYLTLLQRLMNEGAEEDDGKNMGDDAEENTTNDDTPEENASAA